MESAPTLEEVLDSLERRIAAKDREIHRLRDELARKEIYVRELRAILRDHQGRFEAWDQRLRRLEAGISPTRRPSSSSGSGKDTCPP